MASVLDKTLHVVYTPRFATAYSVILYLGAVNKPPSRRECIFN